MNNKMNELYIEILNEIKYIEKKMADQEQIIYCKECKHWKKQENATGACHRSENSYFWFCTDADDYCSFAERIERDIK